MDLLGKMSNSVLRPLMKWRWTGVASRRTSQCRRRRGARKKARICRSVLRNLRNLISPSDFYNTFWSLQSAFSRPTVLAQPAALESFKESVNKVIPVIKEATVRERAMMGSKSVVSGSKRKRDATPSSTLDEGTQGYFFAKYLTSPELLDLEVSTPG